MRDAPLATDRDHALGELFGEPPDYFDEDYASTSCPDSDADSLCDDSEETCGTQESTAVHDAADGGTFTADIIDRGIADGGVATTNGLLGEAPTQPRRCGH